MINSTGPPLCVMNVSVQVPDGLSFFLNRQYAASALAKARRRVYLLWLLLYELIPLDDSIVAVPWVLQEE